MSSEGADLGRLDRVTKISPPLTFICTLNCSLPNITGGSVGQDLITSANLSNMTKGTDQCSIYDR